MKRFIGRKRELSFLEEKYSSPKGELVFLYGRRRVGKTETLKEFCKDKNSIFYTCTQIEDKKQLKAFSETVRTVFDNNKYFSVFDNWENAFSSVVDYPQNENGKRILIIDEFPYAVMENNSIASILQKAWDSTLKNENILIILCGSSMSFIEKEILSEKNPLYGRATGIYKMEEMSFFEAIGFLDGYTNKEKLTVYSICGGIPYYLEQFDSSRTLKENIIAAVLKKGSVLYSEPEFLLRSEMREPSRYNTIILSIALGKTKFSEIQSDTLIEKSKLSVYLKHLIELGLIERELPIYSPRGEKTNPQRGIYRIKNSFFRFWYAFIFPYMTLLEYGDAETVYTKLIEPNLDYFASPVFEDVCIEYLKRKNMLLELPFIFTDIGRWWNKTTEIDAIALDRSGNIISAECKYRNKQADIADLKSHIEKEISALISSKKSKVYYCYFSFAGFKESAIEFAKKENMTLITGEDIFA